VVCCCCPIHHNPLLPHSPAEVLLALGHEGASQQALELAYYAPHTFLMGSIHVDTPLAHDRHSTVNIVGLNTGRLASSCMHHWSKFDSMDPLELLVLQVAQGVTRSKEESSNRIDASSSCTIEAMSGLPSTIPKIVRKYGDHVPADTGDPMLSFSQEAEQPRLGHREHKSHTRDQGGESLCA
jgi:hypothetical protein